MAIPSAVLFLEILMIENPTRRELPFVLDAHNTRQAVGRLVVDYAPASRNADPDEPLPTRTLLKAALHDWLVYQNPHLTGEDARQAVLATAPQLDTLADQFDRFATIEEDDATGPPRPACAFMLLDDRFVAPPRPDSDSPQLGFYDLHDGVWTPTLDYQAKTVLLCDLNVLLLRLLATLELHRQRQQKQEPLYAPSAPDDFNNPAPTPPADGP